MNYNRLKIPNKKNRYTPTLEPINSNDTKQRIILLSDIDTPINDTSNSRVRYRLITNKELI